MSNSANTIPQAIPRHPGSNSRLLFRLVNQLANQLVIAVFTMRVCHARSYASAVGKSAIPALFSVTDSWTDQC